MTEKKKANRKSRSYGRTTRGVELTDETLKRMAAEAEAGLDVRTLRPRPDLPPVGPYLT